MHGNFDGNGAGNLEEPNDELDFIVNYDITYRPGPGAGEQE
jgi:hypothetical protein